MAHYPMRKPTSNNRRLPGLPCQPLRYNFAMRRSLGLIVAFVFAAVAFGGQAAEKAVLGTWHAQGTSVVVKSDKSWIWTQGTVKFDGTWAFDKGDFVMTPLHMNGQAVGALKKKILANRKKMSAGLVAMAHDLDLPNFLKLSPNGKMMKTDKARDKNSGPPLILTKG